MRCFARTKFAGTMAGLLCVGFSGVAIAADDPASQGQNTSWFAGVRTWVNSWDIPLGSMALVVPNPATGRVVLKSSPTAVSSGTEISAVPFVGVKSGPFSISLAHQAESKYSGNDVREVRRKETDLTLGYSILPSLTVSLAWKEAKISQTVTDSSLAFDDNKYPAKIDVLLIGLAASAPISDRLGIYGNVAYGPARTKINYPFASDNKFDGDYRIGEFGVSYRIPAGGGSSFLKGLTVTAGYRTQVVKIKDLPFPSFDMSSGAPVFIATSPNNQTSTTQGLVLGLIGSF